MEKTLIIIHSKNFDRRVEILKKIMQEKNSLSKYKIAICSTLEAVTEAMLENKDNLAGVILDMSEDSILDIRDFSYKVIQTPENVVPLFVHPQEFGGYEHTKFNLLRFVSKNKIEAISFEKLLEKVALFFQKCDLQVK